MKRTMETVVRVVGDEEGKGGKGNGYDKEAHFRATSEPTLPVLKEDIVVCKFMHSCAPSLNLVR